MGFDPAFPIDKVRPASYNPRAITPDAIDVLRQSLRLTGGLAKPIIVMPDGLTIAGHQRSKAARLEGHTTVPAFVIEVPMNDADEIRFNQLHNGTDLEDWCSAVRLPAGLVGYSEVKPSDIASEVGVTGAVVRAAICELILKYGAWGGVVATESGRVLSAPQYALACRSLGIPCRVYRVRDEVGDEVAAMFSRRYGEFSYDHIERATWRQTHAQMFRLRETGTKQNRSALYETMVIPSLKKGERILDFGCGQADYVNVLSKLGHKIRGIEFFFRDGGSISPRAVRRMIDAALADICEHGLFDVVVCDSVLNSVDSAQAEADVMTCLNAFCGLGGRVYFAGRTTDSVDARLRSRHHATSGAERLKFLDSDGMTATYRTGGWFFQKFHTEEQVTSLTNAFFGDASAKYQEGSSSSWQVSCQKVVDLDEDRVRESLRREFDLPWPKGSVGRSEAAVEAWEIARRR